MEYLFVAFVVVALITIVGHALWVFVARLFGGARASAPVPRRCPRCGVGLEASQCTVCYWPLELGGTPPNTREALERLAAQVGRLGKLNILDAEACQAFTAWIDAERQRLAHRKARATAPRAPEPVVEATLVAPPPSPSSTLKDTPPSTPADKVAAFVARHKPPAPPERTFEPVALESAAPPLVTRELDAPPILVRQSSPPAAPRASWTDWLAGFMEERNIRWGELVGGLLIVCSSIALVISFWSAIEARPWLKFLLFNGVTAATFGAGFYCEHRLRLHTTAQGLLTIGSLLVPLNFLAIAALSSAPDAGNLATIGAEGLSAAFFAALVYFAARVLVRGDAAWLTAGVMVPALSNLLVRRYIDPTAQLLLLAGVAVVPVSVYLVSNLWHLRRTQRSLVPSERQINALLKFLGVTSFAVLLPLALLAYKTGHPILALRQLPLVAALVGFVPLSVGLTLWQQLAGRSHVGLRTAGTAVAVLGAAVSLAGLVIGWPEPSALVPAAIAEFVLLTYFAWRYVLPAAHVPAALCLAVACVLGAHLAGGRLVWIGETPARMFQVLISGESGVLLAPLVVLYAGLAVLARRRRADVAPPLIFAALALMVASTGLLLWFGYGNPGVPLGAGWIYLLYAVGALAWSARSERRAAAWLALALLLLATWQLVVFRFAPSLAWVRPWCDALLLYASLAVSLAVAGRMRRLMLPTSALPDSALHAALAATLIALVGSLMPMPLRLAWSAWHLVWLAALWAVLALLRDWRPLGTLAQLAAGAAAVLTAASVLQNETWFRLAPQPWIDPRMLEAAGLALVAVNAGWIVTRLLVRHLASNAAPRPLVAHAAEVLDSPWLLVDRVTTAALVALVALLATVAVLPGTLTEIAPMGAAPPAFLRAWQTNGFDYQQAGQGGAWLLAGAVAALLLFTLRQQPARGWLYAILLVVATAAPLAAARFEAEGAVASALVWSSTLFLLAGSLAVWLRGPLARFASQLGFVTLSAEARAHFDVRHEVTLLVLLLGLFAPLLIALTICGQALGRGTLLLQDIPFYLLAAVLMAMLATVLWALESRGQSETRSDRLNLPIATPALALVLGVVPLVGILLYHVAMALAAVPIRGPDPTSFFARLGYPLACSLPLALAAIVQLGYALRERSGRFALAAGIVTCLTATAAWLLANPQSIAEPATWLRLAQLTATTSALFTLGWVWLVAWDRRSQGRYGFLVGGPCFDVQSMLGPAIAALTVGWIWISLVWQPAPPFGPIVPPEFADLFGIASLALVVGAVWLSTVALERSFSRLGVSALLVAAITVAAGIAARWDQGTWLAFRTLYTGHALIAAGLILVAPKKGTGVFSAPGAFWPGVQIAAIFTLALRMFDDYPWWAIAGGTLAGVALAPAMATLYRRRRYLYVATPLILFAGYAATDTLNLIPDAPEFFYWGIIFLAIPVPLWLAIELRAIRPRAFAGLLNVPPMHRLATWLALLTLVLTVAISLLADAAGQGAPLPLLALNWIALAATFVAALALLWDDRCRDAVGILYLLGLTACGMLLDVYNLTPPWLLWTGTIVLAAYALATSYLWSCRAGLVRFARSLGVPRQLTDDHAGLAWLVPTNLLLVVLVIVGTLGVLLTSGRLDLRILAAQATLVQVASLALLARGERRDVLQHAALSVGAIGAVYFGWSWLLPDSSFTLLHALAVAAAATAGVGAFYGLGLVKLLGGESPWLSAARRMMLPLVAISIGAVLATLAAEVGEFAADGSVRIAPFAIATVALTLAGLAAAALAAAILPGRDPLALSERGRTVYVYAAEILLGLLFVHIRITLPWLFSGFFQQFWPLVVMALAFLGVGCGELFRRRQQRVLAEPLENTGALLPVLPVLGYWFAESQVDYSLLLLGVGVLYAGLSIARRSFGFGVLAALAANGGLWFFLGRQDGWGFLAHPQVWLIPPAVCVLAAAYLNRRQLADAQMTAIRYASSMAIYLSSTADIFLNGVAQAPWLPVVLALFSVLGILAGILLRVRAFLLLGTGFLALALFTVIWYAAVDLEQTWIWFACLGLLGLVILVLFAFFEKRRQDILEVVERLKQWEA